MSQAAQDHTKAETRVIALSATAESAHRSYHRHIAGWDVRPPSECPIAVKRAADTALRRHTATIKRLGGCQATTPAALRAKAAALATDIGTPHWRQQNDPHVVLALSLALDILGIADFPTESDFVERYLSPAA